MELTSGDSRGEFRHKMLLTILYTTTSVSHLCYMLTLFSRELIIVLINYCF